MSWQNKIFRTANAPRTPASEIEQQIAQYFVELESNVADLKTELRQLQFSSAAEIDCKGGKKAVIIFVPVPQVKAFHTVQARLTRELEKKLSDKTVIFLSQRRVLPKPKRNSSAAHKQKRPRSRTLGAVHEKILDDLVWPSEITGKRTRVAEDGGKLIRVYLDPKDQAQLEYKLDTFSSVYRQLAGKDVHFEFPVVVE